jgi:ATP-dependent DNA ligase
MELIVNYKKRIASRFQPLEGTFAYRDLTEADEYIYSEKIDGHLGFASVTDGVVTFYNRSGTLLDLPSLSAAFPTNTDGIWAGELYLQKERSRSFLIASAIANAKDDVCFAIFDAVHELEKPMFERIALVEKSIVNSARIHPVKWMRTKTKQDIYDFYNETVEAGKEGIIVHADQGSSYKLKPTIELDLTVVGYSMKEDGSGIRSVLVGVKDEDQWLVVASVGGGFTVEQRSEWQAKLEPLVCEGDIVMVAKNKMAYLYVKPEIVIQIKCLEAINEDSSGLISKEVFVYDSTKGYLTEGKTYGVSLVSPVFMGIRTDKTPGLEDTGIKQFTDRLEIADISAAEELEAKEEAKEQSEIVFRKVYTKESKTGTAVRKFVGLKTNRDKHFSNYILHYTDFSAGRKEPLQTEVSLASTEDILREKLVVAEEENIKKGWVLVDE